MRERRGQPRCAKTVDMHCTLLNGNVDRPVVLRNYSGRGLYFETAVQIMPGTYIEISTQNTNAVRLASTGRIASTSEYPKDADDPGVCSMLRSHAVAHVRRCERLTDNGNSPYYGVAAEIQTATG